MKPLASKIVARIIGITDMKTSGDVGCPVIVIILENFRFIITHLSIPVEKWVAKWLREMENLRQN